MITCVASARDNDALYDAVSASRRAPAPSELERWASVVKGSYRRYSSLVAAQAPKASILDDPGNAEGDLLRGNWEAFRRIPFRDAHTGIFNASCGICCLCGHANAGEVDHYLPKNRFPEYTIYTDNLIAACGRCNRKKASRFERRGGGPAFIHPYLDQLPDEQFLVCDVRVTDTVLVNFKVVRTPQMDDVLWRTLSCHFVVLELASFYMDEAVGVMGEQLNNYYTYYHFGGAGGVAQYLALEARSTLAWHRARGPVVRNHWKPVLLSALSQNTHFCGGGFMMPGPELPVD